MLKKESVILNFCVSCALESLRKLKKIRKPRLHAIPITSESMRVEPRSLKYFLIKGSPGDSKAQPRLRKRHKILHVDLGAGAAGELSGSRHRVTESPRMAGQGGYY
jgi:hypothetical protein